MKPRALLSAACLAAIISLRLHGEDPAPASPSSTLASIRHSLDVPEFTPPESAAPKQVPAMRIDAATTVPAANGKTLTILRGEASTLPDIPLPPESRPIVQRVRTPEDEAREKYRRRHTLLLGATVYDHRVSLVRWQHPDKPLESYEALCGFDVGLLAGIGSFVRNGESYSVMLMHSHLDTTRLRKAGRANLPDLSSVAPNSIRFTKGDPADAIGTAPAVLVKELIANEKTRIQIFQADLARHHAARTAWEKANPEPPRDETIWIRPHRGSRYLADPKPEAR